MYLNFVLVILLSPQCCVFEQPVPSQSLNAHMHSLKLTKWRARLALRKLTFTQRVAIILDALPPQVIVHGEGFQWAVRNLYIRFIAKHAPVLPLYSTVVYLLATMSSHVPLAVCCSRDFSNAERMLAATGFTPLLVNLESMTSKLNAGGGSKDGVE